MHQESDVFLAVKTTKINRPQLVNSPVSFNALASPSCLLHQNIILRNTIVLEIHKKIPFSFLLALLFQIHFSSFSLVNCLYASFFLHWDKDVMEDE
jgi:hypothetical protein